MREEDGKLNGLNTVDILAPVVLYTSGTVVRQAMTEEAEELCQRGLAMWRLCIYSRGLPVLGLLIWQI